MSLGGTRILMYTRRVVLCSQSYPPRRIPADSSRGDFFFLLRIASLVLMYGYKNGALTQFLDMLLAGTLAGIVVHVSILGDSGL